jgi:hypothetical protein
MSATAAVSIVLVHGGFVDGSGWRSVYPRTGQRPTCLAFSAIRGGDRTWSTVPAALREVWTRRRRSCVRCQGHSAGGLGLVVRQDRLVNEPLKPPLWQTRVSELHESHTTDDCSNATIDWPS